MDLSEVKVDGEGVLSFIVSSMVKKALDIDQEQYSGIYRSTLRTITIIVLLALLLTIGLLGSTTFMVCWIVIKNYDLAKSLPGPVCLFALMIFIYKRYNIINNFKIRYLNGVLKEKFPHINTQREYVKAVIHTPEDANHWRWIKLHIYELRIEIVDGWLASREDKDERYSYSIKLTQFRAWGSIASSLMSQLSEEYKILSEKVDSIKGKESIIEDILLEMLPKYTIGGEKYGADTCVEREDTEYTKWLCA